MCWTAFSVVQHGWGQTADVRPCACAHSLHVASVQPLHLAQTECFQSLVGLADSLRQIKAVCQYLMKFVLCISHHLVSFDTTVIKSVFFL